MESLPDDVLQYLYGHLDSPLDQLHLSGTCRTLRDLVVAKPDNPRFRPRIFTRLDIQVTNIFSRDAPTPRAPISLSVIDNLLTSSDSVLVLKVDLRHFEAKGDARASAPPRSLLPVLEFIRSRALAFQEISLTIPQAYPTFGEPLAVALAESHGQIRTSVTTAVLGAYRLAATAMEHFEGKFNIFLPVINGHIAGVMQLLSTLNTNAHVHVVIGVFNTGRGLASALASLPNLRQVLIQVTSEASCTRLSVVLSCPTRSQSNLRFSCTHLPIL